MNKSEHPALDDKRADMDDHSNELGKNARRLRKARGWTLSETMKNCGISVSTLSKVENGQLSLTFSNLEKLARGLDVDISELFDKHGAETSYVTSTARESGVRHETKNYCHEYLCQDFSGRKMTPFVTRVIARDLQEFGTLLSHPGQEFLYVLEGTIDLVIDGEEPLRLRAGDSAYFDCGKGHAAISVGPGEALTLSVIR